VRASESSQQQKEKKKKKKKMNRARAKRNSRPPKEKNLWGYDRVSNCIVSATLETQKTIVGVLKKKNRKKGRRSATLLRSKTSRKAEEKNHEIVSCKLPRSPAKREKGNLQTELSALSTKLIETRGQTPSKPPSGASSSIRVGKTTSQKSVSQDRIVKKHKPQNGKQR